MASWLIVARPVALPAIMRQAISAICLASLIKKEAMTNVDGRSLRVPMFSRRRSNLGFCMAIDRLDFASAGIL
jgi:hypothetical protein